MKNIFDIIFIFILILSCESSNNPNIPNGEIAPNPDPSLVGTWHGSTHGKYLNSIREFEYYNYYSYEFKEDNRIWYYSTKRKYGVRMNTYSFLYIWKIENGKYYKKLYDNRYDSWGEFTIEKISDTVIKIDGIELKRT
ncbi:hypothetical protein [Brachyspira aalborgi]|uniref:Lipocalin-like domain-containing protein n=1 Tax=Brachyspira aalborgi TaxID=29522 RepID=A0AB38Q566_9SPIR|nr:hypothetical protein [Brachyspira aalborgi]TXJ28599.1 hypothetical protein EPJ73_01220 [Brachyspira aalborgi]